jgi:signal recognition particle subunit SRP54
LGQIEKMGGMGGIMSMLPGMAKMKDQLAGAIDDKAIKKQRAIISAMTRRERRNPHLLTDDARKASRKKRIAAGSGTQVEAVNRLLKQHRQMADMMKAMGGKGGGRGMMGKLGQMMGMPGMGGPMPSPDQIAAMQKQIGAPGAGLPDAPAPGLSLPPTFPGFGGGGMPKLPGLGGAPFGKKK